MSNVHNGIIHATVTLKPPPHDPTGKQANAGTPNQFITQKQITMELKEAVEIMQSHNKWRRGAETEMCNHKDLGRAIDVLISHAMKSQPSLSVSAEDFLKTRKEFYTPDGKFEATDEFGEGLVASAMQDFASRHPPVAGYSREQVIGFNQWLAENGYEFCEHRYKMYLGGKYHWVNELFDKYEKTIQPTPSHWIEIKQGGEMPDGLNGRLVTFSPAYAETDPMRYRIIDAQFLPKCKDVTHYYKVAPPEGK